MRKMHLAFMYTALFITAIAPSASAEFIKAGNHTGEVPDLAYTIEYLDPKGVTSVDSSGVTFKPFFFDWSFVGILLPFRYFGDYPLYFTGDTLHFKIRIANNGKRTFRNIKIIALEERLNPDGGRGQNLGDNNAVSWLLDALNPGETAVYEGSFAIPFVGESGLDQTHLQILHWGGLDFEPQGGAGKIIIDDFQAGIWCPRSI